MSTDLNIVLNNIFKKIEQFALSQTKPDDLTLQRLKKDAKSLTKLNRSFSAMTLGLLASIEGDYDECVKQHTRSLELGKDPVLNLNHALSMKTLGHNAEAFRLIDKAMSLVPDVAKFIPIYLIIAFNAGQYESIQACEDMLRAQGATNFHPVILQFFDDVNLIVLKVPLPFATYPIIAAIQEKLRLENNTGFTEYTLEEINGELYYWSLVNAATETIDQMNSQLKNELNQLENICLDGFHIAFRAKEISAETNT